MECNLAVVDARSEGIDLSVSLPHQVYPRDALAPATVTVRSLSRQSIVINGDIGLDVAVLSASGETIYRSSRPLMQREIPRTGPGRRHLRVAPGGMLQGTMHVVLRGETLLPLIMVEDVEVSRDEQSRVQSVTSYNRRIVTGTPLSVELVEEEKPRLRLVEVPTVYADLEPVVPVTGPLLYVSQVWSKGHWLTFQGDRLWFSAEGSWLEPYRGGSRKWEWYALAGWLNEPTADIDYVPS